MARPRYPNREIEEAVQYAESLGWEFVRTGSHAWGRMRCPRGQRDGCQFSVWSTPRNPHGHARPIRSQVADCPHTEP
jgi:hypothetical protein